jgi:hypothetical protein
MSQVLQYIKIHSQIHRWKILNPSFLRFLLFMTDILFIDSFLLSFLFFCICIYCTFSKLTPLLFILIPILPLLFLCSFSRFHYVIFIHWYNVFQHHSTPIPFCSFFYFQWFSPIVPCLHSCMYMCVCACLHSAYERKHAIIVFLDLANFT